MTRRALVETTEQQRRFDGQVQTSLVAGAVAGSTLAAVGLGWPAPRQGSVGLAAFLGLAGALVVGPVLAYEVRRWIGWRVVLPLLLQYVPSPWRVRRAPARCATCGRPAGPLADQVLSWALRGGRCRGCGAPVPSWVAAVEVATGGLFALAAWRVGWSWELAPILVLVAGLVAVVAVDVVHQRVPTRFVAVTGSLCAAIGLSITAASGATEVLVAALVGGAAYGGVLAILHLLSPGGLGGGDVRLAWLVGAVVGGVTWMPDQGPWGAVPHAFTTSIVATGIGLVSHLVVALTALALPDRARSSALPFAPAIAAAALLVALLAQPG